MQVTRKGEWWEIPFSSSISLTEQTVVDYLRKELQLSDSWIGKLQQSDAIGWGGRKLRLKLFPERSYGFEPHWAPIDVLYEDDFCLVVLKPAGMKVHPSEQGQAGTLANAVAAHYEQQGERIAVRHIHRLDDDTSGPVLYAKNEFAGWLLDEAMRAKKISRHYLAVAQGRISPLRGVLSFPIGKDRHHNQRRRVSRSGQTAITHYEVVEQFAAAALVRLELETGRTHQIRVHLSHIGHPLLGDRLYGGSTAQLTRQALHGHSLSFRHPFTKHMHCIQAPLPEDLENLLNRLRAAK